MVKKVLSICIVFSLLIVSATPKPVNAQTNGITSDTIITEDNIYEILEYLGIDSSKFEKTKVTGAHVNTVGELKNSIDQVKNLPSVVNVIDQGTIIKDSKSNDFNIQALSPVSVRLLYRMSLDSYEVEFTTSATYYGRQWTAASSPFAEADSDVLFYVYKVTDQDLEVSITYDKELVVMQGTIAVKIYIGVGSSGLIEIGRQVINPFLTWDIDDYYY